MRSIIWYVSVCFFEVYGYHRDLHVLTHSFPPRRSSDLAQAFHSIDRPMRRLAAPLMLFALLGAAEPPLRTVTPVSILATDAEESWVPFELNEGNQIRFTKTVDGHPETAILAKIGSDSCRARA